MEILLKVYMISGLPEFDLGLSKCQNSWALVHNGSEREK